MSRTEHIRKAAQNMVDRYGDDALQQVDLRIDELRKHGEEDTRMLWVEIRRIVDALIRKPGGSHKH